MRGMVLGTLAAAAAALIGAGWQVVTRFGVTTTVSYWDLALIRYALPAVLLMPVLLRHGLYPKGTHPALALVILIGGGLPFGLLVMSGAQFTPVSHIAVLIPGTMPLFTLGLAALLLDERMTQQKVTGLFILLIGVACIGWDAVASLGSETLLGDAMLIFAAFLWGFYTVAFRRSAIAPWHGAALICFWSTVLVVPLWAVAQDGGLLRAPVQHLVLQIVWQGLLAGAVGLWVYGFAIQKIGASASASIGAIVPGLAALGAWLLLGEVPSSLAQMGIAVTVLGVIWSNTSRGQTAKARA